jgi:hypothetical protein
LISRDSNNSKLKAHCKSYCLILSKVIKAAKQLYYNNKISKSKNKVKNYLGYYKNGNRQKPYKNRHS